VTYEGGGLNATTIANIHYWKGSVPVGLPEHRGVEEAMRRWAVHNQCDPVPVEDQISAEVTRFTWQNCEAETVLYTVRGGGHTWPGNPVPGFEQMLGHTTTDIDATALMFELFLGPPASAPAS
jgi:polyhydroxybutyrate depolymerase